MFMHVWIGVGVVYSGCGGAKKGSSGNIMGK